MRAPEKETALAVEKTCPGQTLLDRARRSVFQVEILARANRTSESCFITLRLNVKAFIQHCEEKKQKRYPEIGRCGNVDGFSEESAFVCVCAAPSDSTSTCANVRLGSVCVRARERTKYKHKRQAHL